MSTFKRLFLCACALAVSLLPAVVAAAEKPLRYVMYLQPNRPEPDVKQVGGKEVQRWRNRRVIEVPAGAVAALARLEGFAFLALLDDGSETSAPKYIIPEKKAGSAGTTAITTPPTWDSGEYSYDGAGNITSIGADTFRYDEAQRLVSATVAGVASSYKYDSFGNQIERNIGGAVISAAATDSNHLIGPQYDLSGNQLTLNDVRYSYDAANMVTARHLAAPQRYIYTADDERIGTSTADTEWEWTIRDFSGKVLSRFGASGTEAPWEWLESYHYRDGPVASAVKLEERSAWEQAYQIGRSFHLDHLGTTRLITNGKREKISLHDYHPFGKEQTRFNQERVDWGYHDIEPSKYTGHERDFVQSTDSNIHDYLDYMHARYYSPALGRFLSVDPVLNVKRHLQRPQGWNRYAYVENNPINNTDPTGRCTVTSGWFTTCLQAAQMVGEGLYNAAANSGIGKIFRGAESGDMQLAMEGQAQLTHEILTGLIITSMMPSEGSATVSTTEQGEAWVATRAIQKSGERFFGKAAKGSENFRVERMKDGTSKFSYDTPGRVSGSKAPYEKTVDATGKVVEVKKTTYDPQGNIVHTKDKLLRE
jgi:RHS repeat-associated protein